MFPKHLITGKISKNRLCTPNSVNIIKLITLHDLQAFYQQHRKYDEVRLHICIIAVPFQMEWRDT